MKNVVFVCDFCFTCFSHNFFQKFRKIQLKFELQSRKLMNFFCKISETCPFSQTLHGASLSYVAYRYVEKYDESNNQWLTVANMKSRRRRFGLSEYKSKLYAFGGFQDSQGELRTCEVYEPDSNIWQSIAPMKTNRCDLGAAVLSGNYFDF